MTTTELGQIEGAAPFKDGIVLVVDDEAQVRALVGHWLKSAGFTCEEAADGSAAVAAVEKDPGRYGAIVLDVMMPGVDGFEALGRLKKLPGAAEIPVIFLTASASEREIVRGVEAGATDYLLKPFSGPVLVAKLKAVRQRSRAAWALRQKLEAAQENATTDGLTGLLNRRSFDERLIEMTGLSARHREPLALLMLDIDKFKSVNDTYGHPAGDVALRFVADRVRRVLRLGDLAFRYGGEEFAILFRKCDAIGAIGVYDRLRIELKKEPVTLGRDATRLITVSGGIATSESANGYRHDELVSRADTALYAAKHGGRDKVEVEKGLEALAP